MIVAIERNYKYRVRTRTKPDVATLGAADVVVTHFLIEGEKISASIASQPTAKAFGRGGGLFAAASAARPPPTPPPSRGWGRSGPPPSPPPLLGRREGGKMGRRKRESEAEPEPVETLAADGGV